MRPSRRDLLCQAAAVGAVAAMPASAQSATGNALPQLKALMDACMAQDLRRSPETATSLGLDKGDYAAQKARLDDRSLAQRARDKTIDADRKKQLAAIDPKGLSGLDAINYDTLAYVFDLQVAADQSFDYGATSTASGTYGAGTPYVLTQLNGAYGSLPDFLDTQHSIDTQSDADAYMARMEAFAVAMDQECETVAHDGGLGVVPPGFILDATLSQMKGIAETPADQATLVQSIVRRTREKAIAGDYTGQATKLYNDKVVPAMRRQMALLEALRPKANPGAGVATLPQGEAYYAAALKASITLDMPPEEAHRVGLEQVTALTARLDTEFRKQGMTQGAVWERLRAMFKDPKFLYPNTDAGKAKLIADLNVRLTGVQAKLPAWFGTLPKAKVEIRRVPPATEAGASSHMQSASLDGSRPAIYYIVLRDTAEDPSWLMPTLTYHEAVPGHYIQTSLANEADLPLMRKGMWFNAYGEGWALYAEQLADEIGMYDADPWGHIGYLHDALLRAARIVMDTGLHSRGWTREQAIKYFIENQGDPDSAAISEVERYCVWPGQACAYMVGKLDWLKNRQKARDALGAKFDIRAFHDAGLLAGAMPLKVLGKRIDDYIAQTA